jgi:bifunctional non-homologous end joining protein LigD
MAPRLPTLIRPMLATLGPPPAGAGWGWEWKWDGVRAVAYLDGRGGLRLLSRNDKDMTASYPELAPLAAAGAAGAAPKKKAGPGRAMVLDGEIVALDERGAPSFARLQARMHVRAPQPALLRSAPVRLYLFDLIWLDGTDLTGAAYTDRRGRLEELAFPDPVAVPPAFLDDGQTADDLLAAAAAHGLEGVLAKRLDSPYRPGRRSPDWVKVPLNQTQEAVVIGWSPGAGRRAGMIGSLLLAAHDRRGDLHFIGHVGTGFTQATLRDLEARLGRRERATPPVGDVPREFARHARWVEPTLVGEVQFRNWTLPAEAPRLRHPSWRGLRADRSPADARLPF